MSVNKERLVKNFVELTSLDSPSLNERKVADALIIKIGELGLDVYEDNGGQVFGGNTGNLYFTLKGDPDIQPMLLMAHMDTVVPCENKKIIIDGDIIKSDGTTILGGDDVCGIVEILETLQVIIDENIIHGDIEVALTFGEEHSLLGSKVLEYDRIKSKLAIVLDSHGPIGTTAISGPSQYQLYATFKGKLAHAGLEPEKGINAITVASHAISRMKLGRLDFETTANVGVIKGGDATNIVCGNCEVHFEARSRSMEKLEQQIAHMREVLETTASEYGAGLELKVEFLYPHFKVAEDEYIIRLLNHGCKKVGIEMILEATGGGSDTNNISGKGIMAIDMSCGMTDVHTLHESAKISDMVKATELIISMLESMKDFK